MRSRRREAYTRASALFASGEARCSHAGKRAVRTPASALFARRQARCSHAGKRAVRATASALFAPTGSPVFARRKARCSHAGKLASSTTGSPLSLNGKLPARTAVSLPLAPRKARLITRAQALSTTRRPRVRAGRVVDGEFADRDAVAPVGVGSQGGAAAPEFFPMRRRHTPGVRRAPRSPQGSSAPLLAVRA